MGDADAGRSALGLGVLWSNTPLGGIEPWVSRGGSSGRERGFKMPAAHCDVAVIAANLNLFAFFHAAAMRLGITCEEILMIGDDIEADVGGAQRAGLKGALVRTGKFRPADLERGVTPHAILDSVASLPEWWSQAK